MLAGAVSRFVAAPLDLVKIRFQLQAAPIAQTAGGLYKGVVQACRSIYAEEGIRTFWRLVFNLARLMSLQTDESTLILPIITF
jgi:hypothetical protein